MSDAEDSNAQSVEPDSEVDDGDDGVDLDAFLTSIESKLRGPFSSLELIKAIVTPALRIAVSAATTSSSQSNSSSKPCSAQQYLRRIAKVLSRTDKLTQLRILIALLGLQEGKNESMQNDGEEDRERMEKEISALLQQAQTAPTYDEWVRIVSGLVQNRIASSEPSTNGSTSTMSMGAEAKKKLDKTCKSILQRVNTRIRQTEQYENDSDDDQDDNNTHRVLTATADADPTLAPYYYALLSPSLLEQVLPEVMEPQQHFQVNEAADILHMDAKLEEQKAYDEQEHETAAPPTPAVMPTKPNVPVARAQAAAAANTAGAKSTPLGAGASAASRPTMKQPPKKKSSMFLMPSKPAARQNMSAAATGRQPAAGGVAMRAQPVLHARKAGAAQALLRTKKNGMQRSNLTGTSAATAGSGVAQMAASRPMAVDRHSHQRSRMKMMDVAEVQDQFRKQQQTAEIAGTENKKKRKTDAAVTAAEEGKDKLKGPKISKGVAAADIASESVSTATQPDGAAAAAVALSAYQQAKTATAANDKNALSQGDSEFADQEDLDANHASQSHHRQQDWRQLLKERSNRLAPEDRLCIEQFFQHAFGDQEHPSGVRKVKLHEERLDDRKETYYLELDYDNMTSKQSKKTKRYNS